MIEYIKNNDYSPVSLRAAVDRSGLRAITEVRLLGIGKDGLGLDCIAARACWTASCLTSIRKNMTCIKKKNKKKSLFKIS